MGDPGAEAPRGETWDDPRRSGADLASGEDVWMAVFFVFPPAFGVLGQAFEATHRAWTLPTGLECGLVGASREERDWHLTRKHGEDQ